MGNWFIVDELTGFTMTHFYRSRFLLASLLLLACMAPFVAAFTVSSVNVTPGGFQSAGTSMTVVSILNFPAAGATTFPPDSELLMSTDLIDPSWRAVVAVDGNETPRDVMYGREMTLPGTFLSYLPSQAVQLTVTLSGKMPSDRHPGEAFLKIQERDPAKNIVSGHQVDMPEVPLASLTTPSAPATGSATITTSAPVPAGATPASPAWAGAAAIAMIGSALFVRNRE